MALVDVTVVRQRPSEDGDDPERLLAGGAGGMQLVLLAVNSVGAEQPGGGAV